MAENKSEDSPSDKKPIEPEVDPAEGESEESRAQASRRITTELRVTATGFSGPLPRPEILKSYNEAFAGCAERIVAMAERQSAHRQEIEKIIIDANCKAQSRGQWFAFVPALVIISGGVYLLAQGKSVAGFSAIILAVASLIGALVYGHTAQKKEREQKARGLPQVPDPSQEPN